MLHGIISTPIHYYICFLLLASKVYLSISTKDQCEKDCQATGCPLTYTNASRLVGPTRPFHRYDILGNPLSLTRPYPYAIAAEETTIVTIHVDLIVHMLPDHNGDDAKKDANSMTMKLSDSESSCIISVLSRSVETFQCVHITIHQEHEDDRSHNRTSILNRTSVLVDMKLRYSSNEVRSHSKKTNETEVKDWFSQRLVPTMIGILHWNDTSGEYLQRCLRDHAKVSSADGNTTTRITHVSLEEDGEVSLKDTITLHSYNTTLRATPLSNPYSPFCEVGCEIFYTNTTKVGKQQTSSNTEVNEEPISLVRCRHLCDNLYSYNLSVGYNDLMEVARLECHDGCFIGWKRCQPGYYCSQRTSVSDTGTDPTLIDLGTTSSGSSAHSSQMVGMMIPCPPGTYREVSYLATEKCVPCPPGRYRTEQMGTSLSSCTKCPAGLYAPKFQSTSLQDCIPCPEGTFTKEEGSGSCICITPSSCANPQ